jgi:hypothetical protein
VSTRLNYALQHSPNFETVPKDVIPDPQSFTHFALPAHSPNLNAYAERWVRSVKEECLSKIILFGERSLRRALSEYVEHYQELSLSPA